MSRSLAKTIERALRHKGASSVRFEHWSPPNAAQTYFVCIPGTSWESGAHGSMARCIAWLENRADEAPRRKPNKPVYPAPAVPYDDPMRNRRADLTGLNKQAYREL